MLDELTHEKLAPYVSQTFKLLTEPPLELKLSEVTPHPSAARGANTREPFSLLFHGPPEPVLPQRIYPLEHPELGKLELFLVPIGPDPNGTMQYEAVFN